MLAGMAAVLAAAGLAWLGFYLHNVNDLPGQTVLSPETLYPTLVTVTLVTLWIWRPVRVTTWLLFGWTALHLFLGGMVTVLPLPVLPFDPEQTVEHYTFHVVYTLTQVPLFVLLGQRWRAGRFARCADRPRP